MSDSGSEPLTRVYSKCRQRLQLSQDLSEAVELTYTFPPVVVDMRSFFAGSWPETTNLCRAVLSMGCLNDHIHGS